MKYSRVCIQIEKFRIVYRYFGYYTEPVVLKHLDCLPYFSIFMRLFGIMEAKEQDSVSQ
jgi:hypothetical protein